MNTFLSWIDPPPRHRALYLAASFALLAAVVIAAGAWLMPAGLDAACREVPVRPVQYLVGW